MSDSKTEYRLVIPSSPKGILVRCANKKDPALTKNEVALHKCADEIGRLEAELQLTKQTVAIAQIDRLEAVVDAARDQQYEHSGVCEPRKRPFPDSCTRCRGDVAMPKALTELDKADD